MTKGKTEGLKRKRSTPNKKDSSHKRVKIDEEVKIEGSKLFTDEALSNLKIYNELKTEYEEEGVNQLTHQFLSRISKKKIRENAQLNKTPLMQYLSNACKIMMLNEFEISAWAVWLDSFKLDDDPDYNVEDYILNTAFYIKMTLNNDDYLSEMFQSYFNWYMYNFINRFNEWLKGKAYQFNPIVVNKKFKDLNKPYNQAEEKDFLDYNHLVDDILQISPPYNYWNDKKGKTEHKSKAFEGITLSQINNSQFQNSLISASQASIVPTKPKIHTIKYNATPQQLAELACGIPPDHEIEEIEKSLNADRPLTRLMKKSSTFSINDIKTSTQRNIDTELFNKQSQMSHNMSQFYNMYNLQNDDNDNNIQYNDNMDSLFLNNNPSNMLLRSNSKITRSIPRRPTIGNFTFILFWYKIW
jgi:hypothetical protein